MKCYLSICVSFALKFTPVEMGSAVQATQVYEPEPIQTKISDSAVHNNNNNKKPFQNLCLQPGTLTKYMLQIPLLLPSLNLSRTSCSKFADNTKLGRNTDLLEDQV